MFVNLRNFDDALLEQVGKDMEGFSHISGYRVYACSGLSHFPLNDSPGDLRLLREAQSREDSGLLVFRRRGLFVGEFCISDDGRSLTTDYPVPGKWVVRREGADYFPLAHIGNLTANRFVPITYFPAGARMLHDAVVSQKLVTA